MTRETKIGLLVGLAFIIVIGILLSDHMTATSEPIPAALANTAGNVRQSVEAPISEPPPITTVIRTAVTPHEAVAPANESAQPARSGQAIVSVGPAPAAGSPIQIHQATPAAPASGAMANSGNNADAPAPTLTQSLAEVAKQNGEAIVSTTGAPITSTPAAAPQGGMRKYTVETGDSLSRIASRFMGSNTKANRDAIIKANPSLRDDPNKIVVGRTYLIPPAPSATPATAETVAANSNPAAKATEPAAPAAGQYWYTVKGGDNLWSIASEQLGNGGAWTAIKELNADVLKGGDTVTPNMRLRLPARPVASAAQ